MKRTPAHDRLGYKSFYRRNLPHIQPLQSALFVTFRLAGSLPEKVLAQMAQERRLLERTLKTRGAESKSRFSELTRHHFAMLESCLGKATTGPTWLADTRIAQVVVDALHYRDNNEYGLDVYSIMPNHVHAVFAPLPQEKGPSSISSIMHSLKRNTARQANLILHRSGAFWEHESFDHYIRNPAERKRIIEYVLENPVKAGLVNNWKEWPWNYLRESLTEPHAS